MYNKPNTSKEAFDSAPHILLAEDDKEMRELLAWILRKDGYLVTECKDGLHLLKHIRSILLQTSPNKYQLLISDIRMPEITGMEILEKMRYCSGFLPTILITAFGDEEIHKKAQEFGAITVFNKPFNIDDFLVKIREVLFVDKGSCQDNT